MILLSLVQFVKPTTTLVLEAHCMYINHVNPYPIHSSIIITKSEFFQFSILSSSQVLHLYLIINMISKLRRPIEIPKISSSPAKSSNSTFAPKSFSNPVSFNLDEENFLVWKHQALASIKGHKLQKHLCKENIPKQYNLRVRSA